MRHRHRRVLSATSGAVYLQSRHYATKYTAKVTSKSPTGRTLSVEVTPPSPLPLDSRGYPLPRRHLICKATNILLHNQSLHPAASSLDDRFHDLSDYLSTLSLSLTPDEASEILKSMRCPRLALKFFQFCPSLSPNFRHTPFTYNRLILIASKSALPSRFDIARSLTDEMLKSDVRGTISTVNLLIGLFGDIEDLERCVELVKRWDLRMNCYTYKCLVQAFLRSRDSQKALNVYMEMRKKGYKLDIFAYNMLLDALAKDEKVCFLCTAFN